MFSTILAATDGSDSAEQAVAAAAELAVKNGAELHLVTAYQPRTGGLSVPAAGTAAGDTGTASALLADKSREMLNAAAGRLPVTPALHALAGEPADVIVSVA